MKKLLLVLALCASSVAWARGDRVKGEAIRGDVIANSITGFTPKYATIAHGNSGDNEIVAAVTGKKIRVIAVMMIAQGSALARFESGAGGTALTGQLDLKKNTGFSLCASAWGWFETAAGQALNLELSAATTVDGMLVYIEVD